MKTSQSHPLQIESVQAGAGEIGLTFCPGKKQIDAASGSWDRDLELDLQTIKDWGAAAVVSVLEDHELKELGVPDLGEQIEANGLEWHHLPVVDVGIPSDKFQTTWTYSGHRLRSLLQQGNRVLIHFKGGLGRTGTIAGRLMVELGDDPNAAVEAIRAARPGSIETTAQEQYVLDQSAIEKRYYADRVLGCLFGGAVGDAFGYEVEFMGLKAIQSRFGDNGVRDAVFHNDRLIVSDDTQMTLFTLEGLLRAKLADTADISEQIRQAYLDWYSTQTPLPEAWQPHGTLYHERSLWHNRAPGNTCMSSMQKGAWGTPENRINDSKGCGGVMRVAPIGLVRQWSPSQAFAVAARAAAATHGHPSGYLSAAAMAAMVRMLVDGVDLKSAAIKALDLLAAESGHQETKDAILHALDLAGSEQSDHTGCVRQLGEGWVGDEALAIALYAALTGSSFREVLAIGANHDGDSDSTASIAGQLYGAWQGLSDLPHPWTRRLDVFDPMMALVNQLISGEHTYKRTKYQRES